MKALRKAGGSRTSAAISSAVLALADARAREVQLSAEGPP